GWAPQNIAWVEDLAERAAAPYARRRAVMRFHRLLWPEGGSFTWTQVASRIDEHGSNGRALINALLTGLGAQSKADKRLSRIHDHLSQFETAARVEVERV